MNPEELHAQLSLLAQLGDTTITEEIRQAIEAHVARNLSESDLSEQAEAALAEIDKETATRRKAIEALIKGRSGEMSGVKTRKRGGQSGDEK